MAADDQSGPEGVEAINLARITPDQALAIGALLASVWPKPGKDAAYRAGQLTDLGAAYDGPSELAPHAFIIRDGDQVIANAVMEPRVIDVGGAELTVFGLGKVGNAPDRRGQGLGARVVRGAFGMIDTGVAPFSLFQTSFAVRPFYERLGCRLVENRVVNSLGDDPEANPFWDEVVMRYPAGEGWPQGVVDLRGPGY